MTAFNILCIDNRRKKIKRFINVLISFKLVSCYERPTKFR